MSASLEVNGMEEIQRRLMQLGNDKKIVENKAVREGAQHLLEKMKEEVPVSNINHTHIRDDLKITGVKRASGVPVVEVGPGKKTAWRARFLEFGTVKMSPNPFISRSVKLSKEDVKAAIKSELRRGLGL